MKRAGRRFDSCFRHGTRRAASFARIANARFALAVAAAMATAFATGCAHAPSASEQAGAEAKANTGADAEAAPAAVYIVLRHGEKADDGSRDPALAEVGKARAARIAAALRDAPLQAVYATAYRRTQSTAAPAAAAHGLQVRTYEAGGPAAAFAAELRAAHPRGTVLVVGHSNTVPALAAALCACPVAPMAEDAYGRWIEVRVTADGRARLAERAY